MVDSKIIFIGPLGGGRMPKNGASIKNFYIVKKIKELTNNLSIIDTERWKQNPLILFRLFLTIIFNRKAKYILSLNNNSAYRLLAIFNYLPFKRCVFYWVIGGSIAEWIQTGKVSRKVYNVVNTFLVEGKSMVDTLSCCGFNNAIYIPNFKKITFIPELPNRQGVFKFIFLSRINPHKGCDYILSVVERLNEKYSDRFIVDFYGEVADEYSSFLPRVESVKNIDYKGFIDLRENVNYNILAQYDAMLFPTFWHGEGFPGILVDAFVGGLPVIASDWHLNSDIITHGRTGFLFPVHDEDSLYTIMENCILFPETIRNMSSDCQLQSNNYDIDFVLTPELFKKIGIVC